MSGIFCWLQGGQNLLDGHTQQPSEPDCRRPTAPPPPADTPSAFNPGGAQHPDQKQQRSSTPTPPWYMRGITPARLHCKPPTYLRYAGLHHRVKTTMSEIAMATRSDAALPMAVDKTVVKLHVCVISNHELNLPDLVASRTLEIFGPCHFNRAAAHTSIPKPPARVLLCADAPRKVILH
jgi:hypothetical protein